MMEGAATVVEVFRVAKKIYDQVKLVKANKHQCQALADRVGLIEGAIRGLTTVSSREAYQASLSALLQQLQEILKFMQTFSNEKSWFKRLVKAGNHQAAFDQFHKDLLAPIQQLNLGLNAQQILTNEKDKIAQAEDTAFIKANQETIISLCVTMLEGMNQLNNEQAIRDRQLGSIKFHLLDLIKMSQPGEAKASGKPQLLSPKYTIPSFDIAFDAKIAEGSFGTIYKGRYNDEVVVIKMIGNMNPEEQKEFSNEAKLMYQLSHPNIPMFYGANLEQNKGCIVMEYMEQSSLDKHLAAKGVLPAYAQLGIAVQVASALRYLGQQAVAHGDLRSANILLRENAGGLIAKVSDFGLSVREGGSLIDLDKQTQFYACCAPELLLGTSMADKRSDIFSFGVLLYELATAKPPFADLSGKRLLNTLSPQVSHPETNGVSAPYNQLLGQLPSDFLLKDLMVECLQVNPAERPTVSQLQKRVKLALEQLQTASVKDIGAEKARAHIAAALNTASISIAATPDTPIKGKASASFPLSPAIKGAGNTLAPILEEAKPTEEVVPLEEKRKHLEMQGVKNEESKDYETAIATYNEAIDLGSVRAKTNLATMILKGRAGDKDKVRAATLMQGAADGGHARAMHNYGLMLHRGDGVSQDEKAAFSYFEKAANAGDANGMYEMARALELGRGVAESIESAQTWYTKADGAGHKGAGACHERVTKLLKARDKQLESINIQSADFYASNMQSVMFKPKPNGNKTTLASDNLFPSFVPR